MAFSEMMEHNADDMAEIRHLKGELEKSTAQLKDDILVMAKAEERILLLEAVMRKLVKGIDDWNEAVLKTVHVERSVDWPVLEEARALLKSLDTNKVNVYSVPRSGTVSTYMC